MNARLSPENTSLWPLNAMMLSAGIIFLLGMAINASSIRGVQENFLELAKVSAEIRTLATHSSELAGSMQYLPRGAVVALPAGVFASAFSDELRERQEAKAQTATHAYSSQAERTPEGKVPLPGTGGNLED